MNTDINSSAAIAWSKLNKTGSNLNQIATRSHTVLSDKGTLTHPQLDGHTTDTGDPHGSTMSISTKLDCPRIEHNGTITIESTGGSGIVLRTLDGDELNFTSTGDFADMIIECESGSFNGGITPNDHERGHLGWTSTAWKLVAAHTVKYGPGGSSSYSLREDLKDLRAIKPYEDEDGNPLKVGEHGDGVWDARTIPEYIRDKASLDEMREEGTPEMAYMDIQHMTGWTISLLKKLDEIDVAQDDKLILLFNELVTIKSRLDVIEQA